MQTKCYGASDANSDTCKRERREKKQAKEENVDA